MIRIFIGLLLSMITTYNAAAKPIPTLYCDNDGALGGRAFVFSELSVGSSVTIDGLAPGVYCEILSVNSAVIAIECEDSQQPFSTITVARGPLTWAQSWFNGQEMDFLQGQCTTATQI